jgi:hypothetical protein
VVSGHGPSVVTGADKKVFISWSGRRSHEVAEALAEWLKKVIQSADPWVSSDMERGVKWLAEIGKSLDVHSIGILCVTPGNVGATWLNFEAGALSKQIGDDVRVIPYLLDFRSVGELQPPLGQFNASLADEQGTFDLVKTLRAKTERSGPGRDIQDVVARTAGQARGHPYQRQGSASRASQHG